MSFFFFQAEDGIRDVAVTGVQTCALPIFYAITPFNFTSIGGNLPTAPAIMGCTVVWKPAATAAYSNYLLFRLLQEAGLPPGVVNFVPGPATVISERLLADRHLGGIHFTGATEGFQTLWKQVATNLTGYADYPRLVGETGGKDFIIAHPSADVDALATGIVRGEIGRASCRER